MGKFRKNRCIQSPYNFGDIDEIVRKNQKLVGESMFRGKNHSGASQ